MWSQKLFQAQWKLMDWGIHNELFKVKSFLLSLKIAKLGESNHEKTSLTIIDIQR